MAQREALAADERGGKSRRRMRLREKDRAIVKSIWGRRELTREGRLGNGENYRTCTGVCSFSFISAIKMLASIYLLLAIVTFGLALNVFFRFHQFHSIIYLATVS